MMNDLRAPARPLGNDASLQERPRRCYPVRQRHGASHGRERHDRELLPAATKWRDGASSRPGLLGVSERTIRRYVVALDDLGIAVDGQRRGSTRVIFARAPSAGRALLPALEEI
jgi:hypothetical protein